MKAATPGSALLWPRSTPRRVTLYDASVSSTCSTAFGRPQVPGGLSCFLCNEGRLFLGTADGSVLLWHSMASEEEEQDEEAPEPERRKKEKWRAKKKVTTSQHASPTSTPTLARPHLTPSLSHSLFTPPHRSPSPHRASRCAADSQSRRDSHRPRLVGWVRGPSVLNTDVMFDGEQMRAYLFVRGVKRALS